MADHAHFVRSLALARGAAIREDADGVPQLPARSVPQAMVLSGMMTIRCCHPAPDYQPEVLVDFEP